MPVNSSRKACLCCLDVNRLENAPFSFRISEGLLPSPGWEGRYDWDGYADPMLHPYDQDPAQGWLGTANQRVIPHGYGMQLSNAWSARSR